MFAIDWYVLLIYLAGVFAVGLYFSRRNQNTLDMFSAGGRSPWWVSGVSAFMTMFSANTFVVWGGIAYKYGFVAVAINLMYGVAALLAGFFVAGKWKRIGIHTPGQFISLRFGKRALHFYIWFMMIFRIVGTAGALYALGTIMVGLMPLDEGNLLRDPQTGNLSLSVAIVIFGSIVVLYTMLGGLWAVLMTDVLQFIVLNLSVLFVIPLVIMKIGGINAFINQAPQGFFLPVVDEYAWWFLAGWCAIHFFMIGAEWAFVQRFICVPTERDARKSTYLFGFLYLVSPVLWLLPPLMWRIEHPIPASATKDEIRIMAEQAYILSCQAVLPTGMVGLMFAAMFSATASMISSQLNVFSGVLTKDVFQSLIKHASERQSTWAGRLITVLLGGVLIQIAVLIPRLGGIEKIIISVTELMVVALLAPTLWGLFSRTIHTSSVWITAGTGFTAGFIVRFGMNADGFLAHIEGLRFIVQWVQENQATANTLTGVALPVMILAIMQWTTSHTAPGYRAVETLEKSNRETAAALPLDRDYIPAKIVAWNLLLSGMMVLSLVYFSDQSRGMLALFAGILLLIAGICFAWIHTCKTQGMFESTK